MTNNFKPGKKYVRPPLVDLPNRTWVNKTLNKAPIWCSVDLRDGNQSLINPMSKDQKLTFFKLLCEIGFKEIEIGFPSAAKVEFDFARTLIEQKLVPDNVVLQVLCQAREHLIRRTFQSLAGAKTAIFHLYNSTSENQRRIVFGKTKDEIKKIAVDGVKLAKELCKETDTKVILEYSPESFTLTEIDYALEICEAVTEAWGPTEDNKIILNLPSTVEVSTPNIYADQIEWMCNHLSARKETVVSLHPHNDRGTGVAAAELALLAGADRVEGTLFGNGERTGNLDLINVALNLYLHGVDPELDLSNLPKLREIYEDCTELPIHPRYPYIGDLVFTAFSGSHQDAIKKGLEAHKNENKTLWEVPYIPIDPKDIGRSYEAIIRINSQSGKGGAAYIMEEEFGCKLPKSMHPEFGLAVQALTDLKGREVSALEIWDTFEREFIEARSPVKFVDFWTLPVEGNRDLVEAHVLVLFNDQEQELIAQGNGPIDAAKIALEKVTTINFKLLDYSEHSLNTGTDSQAVAYIQVVDNESQKTNYGSGIDHNINKASIKALISAYNRLAKGN